MSSTMPTRAGLKVAAHAHGDDGIRAAIESGIDCIEHGSLMSGDTLDLMIERGARIACGPDTPAIPHGRNAAELAALVDRGMTPLQAIRAATVVPAELIDVDERGRLEPLADALAVPGDPTADIEDPRTSAS